MNRGFPKSTSLRLNVDEYQELHLRVLRRDGWRCQSCGFMMNLEVHHQNDIDKFVPPKEYADKYPNPFVPPDLRPLPRWRGRSDAQSSGW